MTMPIRIRSSFPLPSWYPLIFDLFWLSNMEILINNEFPEIKVDARKIEQQIGKVLLLSIAMSMKSAYYLSEIREFATWITSSEI